MNYSIFIMATSGHGVPIFSVSAKDQKPNENFEKAQDVGVG